MMTEKKGLGQKFKDALGGAKDALEGAFSSLKSAFGFDLTAKYKVEDTDKEVSFPIDMEGDTVWATQAQMAELFGVQQPIISKHIADIYEEGEADKAATYSKMELVRQEGERSVKRQIDHYNLDVILAVGYRVSGKKATAFRKWATGVLKGYIQDGYALDGKRLENDPTALLKLAQEVRAIRTSEKALYLQVREVFSMMAIDYDKDADEARRFFASAQDIMHYASSEKTATEIIVERADASKPNMGITALGNMKPTAKDVTVAKNYCSADELRKMEIIGESFLLYAESLAAQQKQVSMARLLSKFQEMVGFYEYPVFRGYGPGRPTRDQANRHAKAQYEMFKRNGQPAIGRRAG